MMVEVAERKTILHSESAENRTMISSGNDLRRLAKAVGVECDYVDGREQRHQAMDDDNKALAMTSFRMEGVT